MTASLFIYPDGRVQAIYSPEAAELLAVLGVPSAFRAGTVEPMDGVWQADLGGVGGPVLGPFPLAARDEAVAAEVAWLSDRLNLGPIECEGGERGPKTAGESGT